MRFQCRGIGGRDLCDHWYVKVTFTLEVLPPVSGVGWWCRHRVVRKHSTPSSAPSCQQSPHRYETSQRTRSHQLATLHVAHCHHRSGPSHCPRGDTAPVSSLGIYWEPCGWIHAVTSTWPCLERPENQALNVWRFSRSTACYRIGAAGSPTGGVGWDRLAECACG